MVLTSITSGIRDVTVVLVLIVLVLRLYWGSLEKKIHRIFVTALSSICQNSLFKIFAPCTQSFIDKYDIPPLAP